MRHIRPQHVSPYDVAAGDETYLELFFEDSYWVAGDRRGTAVLRYVGTVLLVFGFSEWDTRVAAHFVS